MARYIQRRWDEEDVVFVFELDDAGWVTRHLEFRGRTGRRWWPAPSWSRRGSWRPAGSSSTRRSTAWSRRRRWVRTS